MIFGQDRNELRRMYRSAWQKLRDEKALSPLEAEIAQALDAGELLVGGGDRRPFGHPPSLRRGSDTPRNDSGLVSASSTR